MIVNKLILTGLIFIFLSITLGAFAAHGLETLGVEQDQIQSFETGVRYLFYNGLGMLALAGVFEKFDFGIKPQFRAVLWGTIIFSTSIFGLVLLPLVNVHINHIIGPVTPLGGLILILGWFSLMVKFLRTYTTN